MDAFLIQRWERTKEIANKCEVKWKVRETIELYDKRDMILGTFATVVEAFSFMCGYEHFHSYCETMRKT